MVVSLTPDEAVAFLVRAGCNEDVLTHCRVVSDLARVYAVQSGVADVELTALSGLLHDIGRGKTHTIGHAQVGGDLCRDEGLPEAVAKGVECHTGAGLTADECTLLGLLPRDCVPHSVEEQIVAHVDNLVRGERVVSLDERLMKAAVLPRRIRRRIYHLATRVELICND
ncbi:MAG: HD domain-containing protein [Methanomicrobiales archaeon]|jgi:uncharacterized protein|nr:HD domain-containing protein [Methanomicrobiales archaeon]